MEDKNTGVEINDIILRIRDRQARRDEKKSWDTICANNAKILDTLNPKQEVCTMPASTESTGASLTMKDVEDAIKKIHELTGLEGMRSKCHNPLDYTPFEYTPLDFVIPTKPVEWKLTPRFSMNTVSMVTDPEPGCEIKVDPEDAFTYAMKMLEK